VNNILVAAATEAGNLQFFQSLTTGSTWSFIDSPTLPAGVTTYGVPSLATNSQGHFIAAYNTFDGDSSAIIRQISTDSGATFLPEPGTVVAGSTGVNSPAFYHQVKVAADPNVHSVFKDREYICYTLVDSPAGTTKIQVKRIAFPLDGGNGITLATRGQTVNDQVGGCDIAVGTRGQVAVVWYEARPADPAALGRIMLSRSYDGGSTWVTKTVNAGVVKFPSCGVPGGAFGCLTGTAGLFAVNQFPSVAWDREGGLHVTWTVNTVAGGGDIRYKRSLFCFDASKGCSFGATVVVNGAANDQFFPNIVASDEYVPGGPLDITRRGILFITFNNRAEDGANLSWRPWSAHCHLDTTAGQCNADANWAADQVAISAGLYSNAGYGSNIGEHNGLTTNNGEATDTADIASRKAHAAWSDNTTTACGGLPCSEIKVDRTTN
jgi:hypothetical protein